ncbi:MAG: hypothetical protein LBQ01_09930 [Prevotellaceae bacterium]|nr:hypothetical protein [Prevotellaceae bacterium]
MAKSIPLGMYRSVENPYSPVLHPVRDASLAGCHKSKAPALHKSEEFWKNLMKEKSRCKQFIFSANNFTVNFFLT